MAELRGKELVFTVTECEDNKDMWNVSCSCYGFTTATRALTTTLWDHIAYHKFQEKQEDA